MRHPTRYRLAAIAGLLALAATPAVAMFAIGPLVGRADDLDELSPNIRICKVRLAAKPTDEFRGAFIQTRIEARVIETFHGTGGPTIDAEIIQPTGVEDICPSGVYLAIFENAGPPPRRMRAATAALPARVEPVFGRSVKDRLMAEWVAMAKSSSPALRLAGLGEIGRLRDARGAEVANAAALDPDPAAARAGLLTQYQLRLPTDARRVVEVMDREMLDRLHQQAGEVETDADGRSKVDAVGRFIRGHPSFDYATFLREGIKRESIREDHVLPTFFAIVWKAQRRAGVPALVALLDDADARVRRQAISCLRYTVDANHMTPRDFEPEAEAAEIDKWKRWWRADGPAFVKATSPGPTTAPME